MEIAESQSSAQSCRYASNLLVRLFDGDDEAFAELFCRFRDRYQVAADRKLRNSPVRHRDGEDAIMSVFRCFWFNVADGQYRNLRDTENFERVLLSILRNKILSDIKQESRDKRGSGDVVNIATVDEDFDLEDYRETEAKLNIAMVEILEMISNPLTRQIIQLTLQGNSRIEIAARLQRSERTIQRHLEAARQKLLEVYS